MLFLLQLLVTVAFVVVSQVAFLRGARARDESTHSQWSTIRGALLGLLGLLPGFSASVESVNAVVGTENAPDLTARAPAVLAALARGAGGGGGDRGLVARVGPHRPAEPDRDHRALLIGLAFAVVLDLDSRRVGTARSGDAALRRLAAMLASD